ncbi:MAG: hypothetical protein ACLFP1_00255 [Candidatus Goldiibacteriota bacterium]
MENKKDAVTEAMLQIEKLKKLKEEKETTEEKIKKEEFEFSGPEEKEENKKTVKRPRNVRTARIDRYNFEGFHKIASALNKSENISRITKDKLINMVLKRFLELDIDINGLRTREDIEEMIKRLQLK